MSLADNPVPTPTVDVEISDPAADPGTVNDSEAGPRYSWPGSRRGRPVLPSTSPGSRFSSTRYKPPWAPRSSWNWTRPSPRSRLARTTTRRGVAAGRCGGQPSSKPPQKQNSEALIRAVALDIDGNRVAHKDLVILLVD